MNDSLMQIVISAVDTMPGADAGGISVIENGTVTSCSPSNTTVATLDQLQSQLFEGPCMTAITDSPTDGLVLAHDLAGDDAERWPRFAPEVAAAGYRSMLSIPLTTDGGMRAALNLYSERPHVFDAEARQIAGLFGAQAAVLLYGAEQAAHLRYAVDSRDVIGQAKGILMERFTLDDDEAFQMLVRSSQDTNIKLIDVAHWLRSEAAERRTRRDLGTADRQP